MNDRELILDKIKGFGLTPTKLPELEINQTDAGNYLPEFVENLRLAGAEIIQLPHNIYALDYVKENFPETVIIGFAESWKKYGSESSLSMLNKLESVFIEGQLAVAENGAIWVSDCSYPTRIIPFITQKLILKISINQIVPTMDHAYRMLDWNLVNYGVFIAGPSKTADIEQALVIGAHGPKALYVIIES